MIVSGPLFYDQNITAPLLNNALFSSLSLSVYSRSWQRRPDAGLMHSEHGLALK
jgi:hypothetical protein